MFGIQTGKWTLHIRKTRNTKLQEKETERKTWRNDLFDRRLELTIVVVVMWVMDTNTNA